MDVLSFFPEANNDASNITWAHAVNSKKALENAFKEKAMMFEGDVSLGTVEGVLVPIMAHPPVEVSDITLFEWLQNVIKYKVGIKLDFKMPSVVEPSLNILASLKSQMEGPLWLNADIISLPLDTQKCEFDANEFLLTTSSSFPTSTLSIGWVIKDSLNFTKMTAQYFWNAILQMVLTMQKVYITQPITLPIYGRLICLLEPQLRLLLDIVPFSTLTVWLNELNDDDACLVDLLHLRSTFDPKLIFYDLPKGLLTKFNAEKSGYIYSPKSSELMARYNIWDIKVINEAANPYFRGTETIIIPSNNVIVESSQNYVRNSDRDIIIEGKVIFLNNEIQGKLEINFKTDTNSSHPLFKCCICTDGDVKVHYERNFANQSTLNPSNCYEFRIVNEKKERITIWIKVMNFHKIKGEKPEELNWSFRLNGTLEPTPFTLTAQGVGGTDYIVLERFSLYEIIHDTKVS